MTALERFIPPALRARVRGMVSPHTTVLLRCLLKGYPIPRWGNLRRRGPFSADFGFERGTPIDRFYLERFLHQHRALIRGAVLEIQAPIYTKLYGQGVEVSETIDISSAVSPTYMCDLAQSDGHVPANRFDCFLLPNTLCVLRDVEGSLRHALRVVKPGGTILAATASAFVPTVTDYPDYWRMTAAGWREVAGRVFDDGCRFEVEQHGNAVAAMASLLGLAAEELTTDELKANDLRYPVLVTLRCTKTAPEA